MELPSELRKYIQSTAQQAVLIEEERKQNLLQIAEVISRSLKKGNDVNIMAICTHNSRRSQLMEVWIRVGCIFLNRSDIRSFSGGTEATAFNPRMVHALKSKGFPLITIEEGENPHFVLDLDTPTSNQRLFSKKYSHTFNPQKDYIALMVCDHADQNCPIVFGASERLALKYKDPKEYDDTPNEEQAYLDKVDEIGREVLFLLQSIL